MSISIRALSDRDRERLKECHDLDVHECIHIQANTTPTSYADLTQFMVANQILCSWVHRGVVLVCIRIGDGNPHIAKLDNILMALGKPS